VRAAVILITFYPIQEWRSSVITDGWRTRQNVRQLTHARYIRLQVVVVVVVVRDNNVVNCNLQARSGSLT